MWCRRCCQDVPAIAAADPAGEVVCARCGDSLASAGNRPSGAADDGAVRDLQGSTTPFEENTLEATTDIRGIASGASLLGLDDWGLHADLDHAARLLQQHGIGESTVSDWHRRIDAPAQTHQAGNDEETSGDYATMHATAPTETPTQISWPVWLMVCGGMMSLVFGMILCGWSLGTTREDLWRIGLPALLAGQAVLLLGFVFQLDNLWRNYRQTTDALRLMNQRLSHVQSPHLTKTKHPTPKTPSAI